MEEVGNEVVRYAAIKRSINQDKTPCTCEKYMIQIFTNRQDAANFLLKHYETDDQNRLSDWTPECLDWKVLFDFLLTSTKEDALFHWEWKRRGNFRTYRIIEFTTTLDFYSSCPNKFKLKNGKCVKRKSSSE